MSMLPYADALYQFTCPKYTATPTPLVLSGTSNALSSGLEAGFYVLQSDVEFFIKQGGATLSATTASFRIPANTARGLMVTATGTDDNIAGITSGGTGTLQIMSVK